MECKKCTPAIRFKGFTDAWEQRKFDELYKKVSEKNDLTYGVDKIISVANMYFKSESNISTDEYLKTYNVFKLGDIAFEGHKSKEFAYGRFVENTIGDGIVSHIFDVFRPIMKEYDLNFWKYAINNELLMKNILSRSTKSSTMMNNLVSKDFLKEVFLIPKIEEQHKIGTFFKQLDDTIANHQRELEKYKNLKISYLDRMFPKENSAYPELRFPEFTDAWEQRKLGEVADIFDGTHQTPNYTNSGIMFLSVENISDLKSEKFISEKDFRKEFKIYPEKGDVLMTRIGDVGTANIVRTSQLIAYYVSLALLKPKEIDSQYLAINISSNYVQAELWKRTLHIAFPKKINKGEIEKVNILVPKIEEQHKIGTFFKQLDDTIANHQRELEKYKKIKQAYLEKMFV